jgi:hypothetical protein
MHCSEIEAGVLGEVDRCRLVGGRVEVHYQLVPVGHDVSGFGLEVAGVALLTVSAGISQLHTGTLLGATRLGAPDHPIEASATAVQLVGPVVGGEPVALPVHGESRVRDPVGASPDDRTEVGGAADVVLERLVSQDHIRHVSIAIGNGERHNGAAVGQGAQLQTMRVGEGEDIHRVAGGGRAERSSRDICSAGTGGHRVSRAPNR